MAKRERSWNDPQTMDRLALNPDRVTCVLFDWGNTLVNYPLGKESSQICFVDLFLRRFFGWHNSTPLAPSEWRRALRSLNAERTDCCFVPFATRIHIELPFLTKQDVLDVEEALCLEIFANGVCFDDSLPAIESLLAHGVAVGIVTNLPWGVSASHWRPEFSRHLGRLSARIPVVCCEDTGFRKPHSAPFLRCLEILGQNPKNALMVGDSIGSDIQGALGAGIGAALVRGEDLASLSGVPRFATVSLFVNFLLARLHL